MPPQSPSPLPLDDPWQLQLELQAPHAHVPAVQWAIFDRDPRPLFRAEVARFHGAYPGRAVPLTVLWDRLFGIIPGDHVHLLAPSPQMVLVKSDGTPGRKWIVTKSFRRGGEAYSWCLPFEAVGGELTAVLLDDTNDRRLAELADLNHQN
jgi:hypothetical protein